MVDGAVGDDDSQVVLVELVELVVVVEVLLRVPPLGVIFTTVT